MEILRPACQTFGGSESESPLQPSPPTDPAVLAGLPQPFLSKLLSMYEGTAQFGTDGNWHEIDKSVRISPEQGMWLYDLCGRTKPSSTLEIGLAYGFSTLYFLAAHKANGGGRHIAIDPFQDHWHGIGLHMTRQVGMEPSFRFVGDLSSLAIPMLRTEGLQCEVIFIDGGHRFDDVLVDFTLCDLVCQHGGYIILDDLWMPSIQRASAFISRNRSDYQKIETPIPNIAVYQKIDRDNRPWMHFVEF